MCKMGIEEGVVLGRFRIFATVYMVFLILVSTCLNATVPLINESQVIAVPVINGLNHPWSVAFIDDNDVLITERGGKLWRVDLVSKRRREVSGLPSIHASGQGGLLDIIIHPNFKANNRVFFSYVSGGVVGSQTAVASAQLKGNTLTDVTPIFYQSPGKLNWLHFGSRLLYHDGHLYITLGERYDMKEAQNVQNHLGAVIRISEDGTVPLSNPFYYGNVEKEHLIPDVPLKVGQKAKREIFTYGHRNVQGSALHPRSMEVWAHEHGPKGGDEINILKAGGNYGWPLVTHGIDYDGDVISTKKSAPGLRDPELVWVPSIAPSGMTFYTGDKYPGWDGDLFVGALVKRHLRRVKMDGSKIIAQEVVLADLGQRIRDVRQSPDGYIYVLSDSSDGALYKLLPETLNK